MIYIIQPAGTFRSIHTNHFASVAEGLLTPDQISFITDEQLCEKHISEYSDGDSFLIRLGAHNIEPCLKILKLLGNKGFKVFPNYQSIKNCRDKGTFYNLCKLNKLPIPNSVIFTKECDYKNWNYQEFGEYCIIKPTIGTMGSGIHIVHNSKVAEKLEYLFKYDTEYYSDCDAIVQTYIENKLGKPQSLRVYVFNGKFTASISITNDSELYNRSSKSNTRMIGAEKKLFDNNNVLDQYHSETDLQVSNLNKGGVTAPYFPDKELIEIAEKICKVTGIEFTALDFVQDKEGKYYCLESNIAPHLYRAFVLHHGRVNHPEMIFNYLLDIQHKGSIML